MTPTINPWSSVPSGCGAPDQGGDQTCDAAEGTKNLWVRTGRHWNLNLATFNARTLSREASLAAPFEELSGIAWDNIGLSEVRINYEAYTALTNGHVLCCRGLADKREFGIGSLAHKYTAGNIDEFYSINERVVVVIIKLTRMYRMKVVQAYAPTSSHEDKEIEQFYEDVELAMRKLQTQYTLVTGNFNEKVGEKQAGEQAVGNYGLDSRNAGGKMLVEFAEKNTLRIMTTFFRKRKTGSGPAKALMEKQGP